MNTDAWGWDRSRYNERHGDFLVTHRESSRNSSSHDWKRLTQELHWMRPAGRGPDRELARQYVERKSPAHVIAMIQPLPCTDEDRASYLVLLSDALTEAGRDAEAQRVEAILNAQSELDATMALAYDRHEIDDDEDEIPRGSADDELRLMELRNALQNGAMPSFDHLYHELNGEHYGDALRVQRVSALCEAISKADAWSHYCEKSLVEAAACGQAIRDPVSAHEPGAADVTLAVNEVLFRHLRPSPAPLTAYLRKGTDAETVALLLRFGALTDPDKGASSPLQEIYDRSKSRPLMAITEQFLLAGADIHTKSAWGYGLLHSLASSLATDALAISARLIGLGLDLEARDREQQTPLFVAIRSRYKNAAYLDRVKGLLALGAAVDARDGTGKTPEELARELGLAECVKIFEEKRESNGMGKR